MKPILKNMTKNRIQHYVLGLDPTAGERDHYEGSSPPGVEALRNPKDSNRLNNESLERRLRTELGSLTTRLKTNERSVVRPDQRDKMSAVGERLGKLEHSTSKGLPSVRVVLKGIQQYLYGVVTGPQR